jgi:hypothetical protein
MLPASYQLPAAGVLLIGGVVSCFFGYRLFRVVLAFAGFLLGAFMASSLMAASSTTAMLVAALVGGLIGAAILFTAYFVGVAVVGAGLGAVVANMVSTASHQEPHFLVVVLCAVVGAAAAMYLQRYFIIVGTGFGGAWTMLVGMLALLGDKRAMAAAATGDVWVLYPLDPAPGQTWVFWAWAVLGLIGTAVQVGWTGGEKGRVVGKRRRTKK